jgi:hypothetical protein
MTLAVGKSVSASAKRIGIRACITGLAVVALTACAGNAPDGNNTPWVDPSPGETNSSQVHDFSPERRIPAEYQSLADAIAGDLSESDQLIYASFLDQRAEEADARYDAVAGGERTPLVAPALDNTGDQILNQYFNGLRLAASFSENGDGATQDIDASEKMLHALHDVPNETMDRVVSDFEDQYLSGDKRHRIDELAIDGDFPNVVPGQITKFTLVEYDNDGSQHANIDWVDKNGEHQNYAFGWQTSPDFNGVPDRGNAWVREF